jgi:hypothetical protein
LARRKAISLRAGEEKDGYSKKKNSEREPKQDGPVCGVQEEECAVTIVEPSTKKFFA